VRDSRLSVNEAAQTKFAEKFSTFYTKGSKLHCNGHRIRDK